MVQRMAEDLCRVVRLGRGAALNLGLAVREAVANAIKHGNRLEEGKHVLILFRVEADRLVVAIRDQGNGFDPRRVENPVAPENVYHNHGRGIFFMNAFVDDVTFTRLPSGGTEVRMEKKLEKKRPGRTSAGAVMRQGGKLQ